MPLTLVELYRTETGPICPNRGLPPAPSPAGFCIHIYGIIKVNSPFPSFGQLSLGGGFRLLCTSRSCSPSAQHLLWCQVSFPRRAIRDMPVGLHQSRWSTRPHCHGVADGRAGFNSPATCLLLADAEPFCGLSWSCWSWGESSSFLSWCLGWSTLCSPAPVLPCSLWVLSAPGECSHLKSNTKVIII